MLSTITWSTPPPNFSPRERVVSLLTEGLVKKGVDVTLFAAAGSRTKGRHVAVCPRPFGEDRNLDLRLWESMHISELFEHGEEFDLIHNHFGYLPLTYCSMTTTPIITTLHEAPSKDTLPVFKKYGSRVNYVAVSEAGQSPDLACAATIRPGVDAETFTFNERGGDDLVYYGPIHPACGVKDAVRIARKAKKKLHITGFVQDEGYYNRHILPDLNDDVTWQGAAELGKPAALLGSACALVCPLGFDEPFSLPAAEAMACGTPVIAYRRGGMPELVDDGKTGFLVDSVDGAAAALSKLDGIDRGACRARVEERFSAGGMVDDYLKLYNRIGEKEKREDHRPWGFYRILSDADDCKVKRITVYPGRRLSLQKHRRRAEHWYVFHGTGIVTLDDKDIEVGEGRAIDIPRGSFHRIKNPGEENLVFIEVQTGDYFGEDDIERIEDDYGRA